MSKTRAGHIIRLSDLDQGKKTPFELAPSREEREALAQELAIPEITKLTLKGQLKPLSTRDWRLEAHLGASVVQDCVVTLEPVKTRIDEAVARTYLADFEEIEDAEAEMPEDETVEPLEREIDLGRIMAEALALHLPDYPRVSDAKPVDLSVAAKGVEPLSDEDVKPFAGLAELRQKLQDKGETGD